MPGYDLRHDPPAPVASATILDPVSGNSVSAVSMLLDSGADLTMIPRHVVENLGLQIDRSVEINLLSFDGSQSSSGVVEIHLSFQSLTFRGRYALIEGSTGVIGRDILNVITLTLRGKELIWEATRA